MKLKAQESEPPHVVPVGMMICWEVATTAVAVPMASSPKRVPDGMTMSLLVLPAVRSAAFTVRVKATNALVVLGVATTMSVSTRWMTRPEMVLPLSSAQRLPSNAAPEPSCTALVGSMPLWLMRVKRFWFWLPT